MKTLLFSFVICALTACSTHQLKIASSVPIKNFGLDINLLVTGGPSDIATRLAEHIQKGLEAEGFNIVDNEQATHLTVTISEFKPGKAALRMIIGYGAGRGSLVYNAKYSKEDKVLIDFDGAERFTGTEFMSGSKSRPFKYFAGAETATQILLEEATKHIVDLAIENQQ